jgi:hypothetical protein
MRLDLEDGLTWSYLRVVLRGDTVMDDSLIDERRRKLVEQLRIRAQQQELTVIERPKLIVVKGGKDNAE